MTNVSFTTTADNFGIISVTNPRFEAAFVTAFEQAVKDAVASEVAAVILTVTGKNYPAAFDVKLLLREDVFPISERFARSLRTLELLDRPLIATMPGRCARRWFRNCARRARTGCLA